MDLKDGFPHLSLFSDIDWVAVAQEYEQTSRYVTFPEYLELKAEQGDCPHHLFELAFFDAAIAGLQDGEFFFPEDQGLHLNPSAHFLSFDHDILKMVQDAHDGKISVIERANVLCIYIDDEGDVRFHELTTSELELLQHLEEGKDVSKHEALPTLAEAGLVLLIS